mgnify:CR=1 FL=1
MIDIIKTDDEWFLCIETTKQPSFGGWLSKNNYYKCDSFLGLLQLLKVI